MKQIREQPTAECKLGEGTDPGMSVPVEVGLVDIVRCLSTQRFLELPYPETLVGSQHLGVTGSITGHEV